MGLKTDYNRKVNIAFILYCSLKTYINITSPSLLSIMVYYSAKKGGGNFTDIKDNGYLL